MARNPAPELAISPHEMAIKLIEQLEDNMATADLDTLGAEQSAAMYTTHPDYGKLAARILVSAMHKDHRAAFPPSAEEKRAKKKRGTFAATVERLEAASVKAGRCLFRKEFVSNVRKHGAAYEAMIDHSSDYNSTYFGLRTLQNGYLLKGAGVRELPQHLWMRVAVGFHGPDLERVKETYELLRQLKNIYGTPTLFHMGLWLQQLASCFLTGIHKDSIRGIYDTLKRCALISKTAGGIGMHIHDIRNAGAPILGTGGESSGIVPLLRQFNETARYVDQGGDKRPGAIAIYFEPHNKEVLSILDLRKNHGDENRRARDLFYALWISDLFMKRVKANGKWTLFCPSKAPGLSNVWGKEFEELYERYEREGRGEEIDAQKLWFAIIDSQIETGTPYMLYKDACNRKTNHQHLGTIKSSNLCTEIIEYTAKDETAVCNLSSLCLPRFVVPGEGADGKPSYDHADLHKTVKVVTRNLSRVIDINCYPVISAGRSNRRHRPIGLGVQGLDGVFQEFDLPYESEGAAQLNTEIFETIYHAAVETAVDMAQERHAPMTELRKAHADGEWDFDGLEMEPLEVPDDDPEEDPNYLWRYKVPGAAVASLPAGRRAHLEALLERMRPLPEELKLPDAWAGAYSSYAGSPMSNGVLQPDMWDNVHYSRRWDWDVLRQRCRAHGSWLSLLVAPMPTASTAQIEGNNEAFEPRTSNIYARRTGAGEFVVMNEVLVRQLIAMGLWSEEMKNSILRNNGSVQHLDIPVHMNRVHKTAWEISMRAVIDQAAGRGPFVDQSMSMNVWQESPTYASMSAMHFYAWQKGLKTGMYYLRTRALAKATQVTVPVQAPDAAAEAPAPKPVGVDAAVVACALENPGACDMCSA